MIKTAAIAVLVSVGFAAPAFAQCFGSHDTQVSETPVPVEQDVEVAQSTSPLLLPLVDGEAEADAESEG